MKLYKSWEIGGANIECRLLGIAPKIQHCSQDFWRSFFQFNCLKERDLHSSTYMVIHHYHALQNPSSKALSRETGTGTVKTLTTFWEDCLKVDCSHIYCPWELSQGNPSFHCLSSNISCAFHFDVNYYSYVYSVMLGTIFPLSIKGVIPTLKPSCL
jgi:hypothetical protein